MDTLSEIDYKYQSYFYSTNYVKIISFLLTLIFHQLDYIKSLESIHKSYVTFSQSLLNFIYNGKWNIWELEREMQSKLTHNKVHISSIKIASNKMDIIHQVINHVNWDTNMYPTRVVKRPGQYMSKNAVEDE